MKTRNLIPITVVCGTLAGATPPKALAADLVLPQNRNAFYSSEPIELAFSGAAKGDAASVEFVPDKKELAPWKFTAADAAAVQVVPPFTLAPAVYTMMVNGKASGTITISAGVRNSTMLASQTGVPAPQGGANFNVANAFTFGLLDRNGMPLREPRGQRSTSLNFYDTAIAKDIPSLCYMYWTGYVTHKPWGTQKSWANPQMSELMRLFSLHVAQQLRRYDKNILSMGTMDEPGLSWGKTAAGGMASGFPNWDEAAWYKERGWDFTSDPAGRPDEDWMKYVAIRSAIMKEQNAQAKRDLKTIWPNVAYSTDTYAPGAIMDGTDPMNQEVNDIPSSHVFLDWGTGKLGAIGALYLEKSHDPTSKIAHAMNGQLFSSIVAQPQQDYSYHLMQNAMLAAGLHSNWWLNTGGMSAADLTSVNEPAVRIGPLFDQMTPSDHDVALLWSFTEMAMREKDVARREARKKDGEQIKLMVVAWPENSKNSETKELEGNAYNVGQNYKDQVLCTHQALTRAGFPAHILHEKILSRGVLKNYKTLVIVGQTFELPADARAAIEKFQAEGGRVVTEKTSTVRMKNSLVTDADLTNPGYNWGRLFSMDVKTFKNPREASYYQTNCFMDDQARGATLPLKKTIAQTGARPAITTDSVHLACERHVGGEGALYMVLNGFEKLPEIPEDKGYSIYNYAPYQASFTLQGIKPGSAVYSIEGDDWKKSSHVTNFAAPQNASFEPGEMKLYLVAPRAPSGLNLAAQSKGGVISVTAGLKNLKMPWPLTLTIKDASGATLYNIYRATNAAGQYSESFPIGTNVTSKQYTVSVQSPAADLQAETTVVANPGAVAAVSLADTVRVFDADAITKLLASKPEIVVAYGEKQKALADQLVAGLAKKGAHAKALPEAQVMRKVAYPRIWNPYATYYAAAGEAKTPADAEIKTRITLDAKKDGSFSAKDEGGKEWGDDWKQPNSLVTVAGDGFVDYQNQDGESVYEPGVQLYFNKTRAMTLVKGTQHDEKTTEEFKAKWSRPWTRLGSYIGGCQVPPQLPEAYTVSTHLIALGDSTQSDLVAALQASELLPQMADAKYPGPGKALLEYAWSPFALDKDVIFIGASDEAGLTAGIAQLLK